MFSKYTSAYNVYRIITHIRDCRNVACPTRLSRDSDELRKTFIQVMFGDR